MFGATHSYKKEKEKDKMWKRREADEQLGKRKKTITQTVKYCNYLSYRHDYSKQLVWLGEI